MRAGETDKAVSVNEKKLLDLGVKIAQAFPVFGPADVDVKTGKNGPMLLEINPRFGGGILVLTCAVPIPRQTGRHLQRTKTHPGYR